MSFTSSAAGVERERSSSAVGLLDLRGRGVEGMAGWGNSGSVRGFERGASFVGDLKTV
ncbi:hypothetical protein T492DRAFT_926527 [Pavlovales sp. CCMP2436]|nr:hypothetical protein T492DRAFT_926527 [Pavlovales sp. CCMP2436]